MSADLLRKAAALMRERAEAAVIPTGAGDWTADVADDNRFATVRSSKGEVARGMCDEEAEHIASWHPAVALAVADWLKSVAADVDKRDNPKRVGGRYEGLRIPDEHAALTVARAFLGEADQ